MERCTIIIDFNAKNKKRYMLPTLSQGCKDRYQMVVTEGTKSVKESVVSGVPKGTNGLSVQGGVDHRADARQLELLHRLGWNK